MPYRDDGTWYVVMHRHCEGLVNGESLESLVGRLQVINLDLSWKFVGGNLRRISNQMYVVMWFEPALFCASEKYVLNAALFCTSVVGHEVGDRYQVMSEQEGVELCRVAAGVRCRGLVERRMKWRSLQGVEK